MKNSALLWYWKKETSTPNVFDCYELTNTNTNLLPCVGAGTAQMQSNAFVKNVFGANTPAETFVSGADVSMDCFQRSKYRIQVYVSFIG